MEYFANHPQIKVVLVLSNNPTANVLKIADQYHVSSYTFTRAQFYDTNEVIQLLHTHQVNWIILAGFLWLVPVQLIRAFPDKIVNIHPALLPKFGGKGMYGAKVH